MGDCPHSQWDVAETAMVPVLWRCQECLEITGTPPGSDGKVDAARILPVLSQAERVLTMMLGILAQLAKSEVGQALKKLHFTDYDQLGDEVFGLITSLRDIIKDMGGQVAWVE